MHRFTTHALCVYGTLSLNLDRLVLAKWLLFAYGDCATHYTGACSMTRGWLLHTACVLEVNASGFWAGAPLAHVMPRGAFQNELF